MIPRALHLAFEVPDTDSARATLFYPGDDERIDEARLTGQVPALDADAPWPVVIIVPGVNVDPSSYRWLAERLVGAGLCAVTYSAIGSLGPAGRGITPGIDMSALLPEVLGTRSSATALAPLLERLASLDDTTPVAGRLALDRVAVGGHSAGGTVALRTSDPAWVPGLRAVFSYGAHAMTSMSLGHDAGAVHPIPGEVPVLVAAGVHDGVIAASSDRYGAPTPGDATADQPTHDPVGRTFDEALVRDENDSWLIELADAGHFTCCDPFDPTTSRGFLEPDAADEPPAARELLGDVIAAFLSEHLRGGPSVLEELVARPGVHRWKRR